MFMRYQFEFVLEEGMAFVYRLVAPPACSSCSSHAHRVYACPRLEDLATAASADKAKSASKIEEVVSSDEVESSDEESVATPPPPPKKTAPAKIAAPAASSGLKRGPEDSKEKVSN